MAENLITSISIAVKADTDNAEGKLTSLTTKLKSLQSVAENGFNEDFTESLRSLATVGNLLQSFKGTGPTKTLINNIDGLQRALRDLSLIHIGRLEQIADALKTIGEASAMQSWATTMSAGAASGAMITNATAEATALADVAVTAGETEGALKKTADAEEEVSEEGEKTGGALQRLAAHAANVTSRFKNFLASLKRIAMYRMIRFVLKSITQGFREGIQNMYQYSILINGTFKDSMDRLSTSALYLKNSLGALAAPIINALAPAIDILVDKFVDLLNFINETIAALTGAATWTKALKYPKEYAQALDGATGSAKQLRATLLGFDEINRLDDHTKGARGSAAEMLDYSKMFEEVETEGISSMWEKVFGIGKTKFGVFAGGAATLLALKLGGAFEGLFAGSGATGLLGKFTAVLLAAFGGYSLGNWLYYNVPGIRNVADDLMELLGPKIDVVVNWIGEKFSKIDIGLGLELLSEDIVEFENSVKEGWGIIGESAKVYFDKVHNWMIEWGYALMDFHDIRINFHTSVDSTEWDLFQKKVSGELDKINDQIKNDQIKSAHQNAYNFTPTGTGTKPPYSGPNNNLYQIVDDVSNQTKKGVVSSVTALQKNLANTVLGRLGLAADGGSFNTGELFIARESGPELVAQVGHKTQVANNDQIVNAIEVATANGNAEGNMLLRQAVGVLTQLLNKDTTVVANITTDSITNGLDRQNRRSGRTVVPIGG